MDLAYATPVVCTLATEEVERLAGKNGLAFHELLSAFSNCQLKTHFRSISSHYPLNELRVRFIRSSELRPRPINMSEELMRGALLPRPGEEELLRHTPESHDVDALELPWQRRYRNLLQESLCCCEESMTECPALLLVAVATSDVNPVACFEQLDSLHFHPASFQSGQFDSSVARMYLLVHDMTGPPTERGVVDPEVVLRQMRQKFAKMGAHCQLLLINSLGEPNFTAPDVWAKTLAPVFFPDQIPRSVPLAPVRGCCLSADDMLALRELVHQVAIKEVVPAMEKRVAVLNSAVSSSRKGVKNVIKSWWRKPREAEDRGAHHGAQYRYDQIESQILLLADSALVMKDYETALSMYRLVRDDFKSDKALLHQGCCQVMVATCLQVLEGDGKSARREMEASLRDACATFQASQQAAGGRREVTLATRLATYASLLLADLLGQQAGRHRDAAEVLVRASRDESFLSSAVLLERAAWHYRGHHFERKFAFFIILSGIKYQTAGLEQHAVRCFRASKALYDDKQWVHIEDYVQAHLAKHLTQLGHFNEALGSYLHIVAAGRQSADRQGRFLREFLDLCVAQPEAVAKLIEGQGPEEESDAQVISGVGIPSVEEGSLEVYESQNAGGGQYCASTMPLAEVKSWMTLALALDAEVTAAGKSAGYDQLMEACVKAAVDSEGAQARLSDAKIASLPAVQSVRVMGAATSKNARARGEAVSLGVVIANPLDIPLTLTELQVVATLDWSGTPKGPSTDTAVDPAAFDAYLRAQLLAPQAGGPSLMVDAQSVTLGPRQRLRVPVRVCPFESGALVVSGLKWRLQGQVWTKHALDLPGPLLHDTVEHRAAKFRAPNSSLRFEVREDMPWLEAQVANLPESLLQGQVVQASIKLTNKGRAAAGNIMVKSSASWLQVGVEPSVGSNWSASPATSLVGTSGTLAQVHLPSGLLGAGAQAEIPIWVRGVGGGKQAVWVMVQYSPAGSTSKTVRYVRLSCEVCVLPSMHLLASVAPRPGEPGEFVVSLVLTNFRADGDDGSARDHMRDLVVCETCSLSKAWTMEPLAEPPGNCALEGTSLRLRCQESVVLSFRLWQHGNGPDDVAHQSCWQPGSATGEGASSGLGPALAHMCIDDMVTANQHQCELLRSLHLAAQNAGEAPRSISSVRRENKAAVRPGQVVSEERPKPHPCSAAALCDRHPSDLSLLVTWGAEGDSAGDAVKGNHQIIGLPVCPDAAPRLALSPLALDVACCAVVRHDFEADPVCAIAVTATVSNQLFEEGVGFTLEVARESTDLSSDSSVTWLGPVSFSVERLAPNQSVCVDLCACVGGPGVYELNHFGAHMCDGRFFTFPVQALVTVVAL